MVIGKLYGPIDNPRVQKSLLVAEFNQVEISTTPDFVLGVDNKSPEFLEKFPMGQSPGFETSSGTLLSESAAIAYYIAQSNPKTTLLGSDAEELGKIWQLNLYSETALVQPLLGILLPRMYNTPITPEQEAKHFESLHRSLVYLDDYTAGKTYLVGDRLTLTDINLVCNMKLLYACLMTREMREKYANLTNYFEAMLKIPQFVKIIGEVKYVD